MVNNGVLNLLDPIHVQCLRFAFIPIIQSDLDNLCREWNVHRVQRNHHTDSPCGKPNVLFYQPELFGTVHYKHMLNEDITVIRDAVGSKTLPELGCSDEFAEICLKIMIDNDYLLLNNYVECVALFENIIEKLSNIAR